MTTLVSKLMLGSFLLLVVVACSDEKSATISQEELVARLYKKSSPTIIDVRTLKEYSQGHVPGAINIPHKKLENALGELKLNLSDEIVIYCESGGRASIAERMLKKSGYFEVRHLDGDMQAWREAKLPCQGCKLD